MEEQKIHNEILEPEWNIGTRMKYWNQNENLEEQPWKSKTCILGTKNKNNNNKGGL